MFKLKSFSFLLALLLSVLLLSGCGGSSGGGSSSGGSRQPNDSPSGYQENYDDYDLESVITGSWTASSGSGVAIGPDGKFDLRLISLFATFDSVQVTDTTSSAYITATAVWDAYQGNTYIRTITFSYRREYVEALRLNKTKLRYTFPSQENQMTIDITSDTTAKVIEEGNFGLGYNDYHYNASYEVVKR